MMVGVIVDMPEEFFDFLDRLPVVDKRQLERVRGRDCRQLL